MTQLKSHRAVLFRMYGWLLSFLRPYWKRVALLVICGVLLSASEMVAPKLIQTLIDDAFPHHDTRLFAQMLWLFALCVVVMTLAAGGRNLLQRYVREYASRDLQFSVFQKTRELGYAFYEKQATGDLLSLLNTTVADVQQLYRTYFPDFIQYLFAFAFALVMILLTQPQLGWLFLPSFLIYYAVGPWIEKKAFTASRAMAKQRSQVEKSLYENMASWNEVRVADAASWRIGETVDRFEQFTAGWQRYILFAHLRGTIRRFSLYLAIFVLFVLGAYRVIHHELLVGEFVSSYFYFMTGVQNLTFLITTVTEQQALVYQAERLYDMQQLKPQVREAEHPVRLPVVAGEIRFEGVGYRYENGPVLFENFSLTIQAGEKVAFVGESGSGKTTLLKLLARFYDPQQGRITLDGVPLTQLSLEQLYDALGIVFQETYLFGTSIRENIRFGRPDASEQEVLEAAVRAHVDDFVRDLPDGYDTEIGERGQRLSGGQKQRLSIARLLLKAPSVVLLDEATSALDSVSEARVQEALEEVADGRTMILIAHRLSTVKHCDRIVVIRQGQICEIGTYEELVALNGYFALLASQQGKETSSHAG